MKAGWIETGTIYPRVGFDSILCPYEFGTEPHPGVDYFDSYQNLIDLQLFSNSQIEFCMSITVPKEIQFTSQKINVPYS